MQATAKWIVGIFGLVGGALAAGTQLSGIGALAAGDRRLWVAVGTGAVALFLVGVVIWSAARVLTGGHVTRDVLLGIGGGAQGVRGRDAWSETEIRLVTDPSVLDGHA
ncbi:MAG: hypothetical protein M3P51_00880, partial [Chloroflexota bacterium]|nr:hypothetical protein [Chloroflexota bacterium]